MHKSSNYSAPKANRIQINIEKPNTG